MQESQLEHYRKLPSSAKAAFLVTIHEAKDYSDACRQMRARRASLTRDRKAHAAERKEMEQVAMDRRARAANHYSGFDD